MSNAMGNIYGGPYTLVSAAGEAELPDAVVNLTPHPLVIAGLTGIPDEAGRTLLGAIPEERLEAAGYGCGYALTVPSHGTVRLVERSAGLSPARDSICGRVSDCLVPVTTPQVRMGEVTGDLPSALPGGDMYRTPAGNRVWFVVSLLTAMALRGEPGLPERYDVLTIGPEVRDASGRILGCIGLRRVVA